jgi:signal transduction histidine kinase
VTQPDRDVRGSDAATLHLLIVRFAAISSWLVALALTLAASLTGAHETLLQAVAAGCAGLFFTLQLLADRVNALVALAFGILFVVATLPVISGPESALGASMAIVAMSIVSSIFIPRRHQVAFLGAGTLLMLAFPWLWADTVSAGILPSVIMASSFLIGAIAFRLVRQRTIQADQRFRRLFDRAPVGLVEQDWSEAVAYIETLQPRNARHLQEILLADPDLLARIVSHVVVVQANDAACEILKIPRRRYLGRLRPERVDAASQETWIRQVVGMWSGHPFDVAEYATTDYHGNEGLWLEVRTISVGASRPHHLLLAVTDITQSRQRSRDLADLVREKDEFIATVSHELRTPLTAVVGLANEVLAADDLEVAERRELLQVVVAQANEISHLVEDLLVGARAEIGTVSVNVEPIDLAGEAKTVVASLDVGVPIQAEAACPLALGDPVRTRQIIRNLAVNAGRYGGASSRIVVTPGEEVVYLEVRDNGLPLDEEDRERIFDPYTRAHDRPGVTVSVGLGLTVSRRLSRLMGGDLAYDHDGWESIFRLELPQAPQPIPEPVASSSRWSLVR